MSSDKHSKTEKPTPKRKKEARKEGRVAKSPELMAWVSLLTASILGKATIENTIKLAQRMFTHAGLAIQNADEASAMKLFGEGMTGVFTVVAPLTLGLMVVGVIGNVAQVGWAANTKALKPKFSRLNPVSGFKRMFSSQGLWELGKSILKVSLLAGLAWKTISGVSPHLTDNGHMVPIGTLLKIVGTAAASFTRNAALLGLALAGVDYYMQRRKLAKSMMMSKQEIKDEARQSEGDPMVKGQIRAAQRRMSRMRMMAEIANADAIVVNPTHVSVAIKYDAAKGAPRVVAKGADVIAARIRREAEKHGVPMVEDVPLARTLYRMCEIGDEIPAQLYEAVARLLAFLFALKASGRINPVGGGAHRPPQPFLPEEIKRRSRAPKVLNPLA
jgi:flagellar biosynthetic protein FlhB